MFVPLMSKGTATNLYGGSLPFIVLYEDLTVSSYNVCGRLDTHPVKIRSADSLKQFVYALPPVFEGAT